ncbi:tetratricopeptide repeat protein [Colwellia echini]|uniref:Sel1 repeat family protein n=1 Tax=Colwellia echini TaxID=1982103 RepID=A0ABY3N1J5_9GAMM|nr:tetratricopeptide repeat protein [Colwellia echini]TYK67369.1 sel1 repeat family protein [Colwellia echini]
MVELQKGIETHLTAKPTTKKVHGERLVKQKFTSTIIRFITKNSSVANVLQVIMLVLLCVFIYSKSTQSGQENKDTVNYISHPKIDDIYFLDFRQLSDTLRPKQKYRIAKVVDITGDIVTLLYGNMFYLRQQTLIDSIRLGQLRFTEYFETKRYDLSLSELKAMHQSAAIYMVKRPDKNMLYGNYINDPEPENLNKTHVYVAGKRENLQGLSLLKVNYLEDNLQEAFKLFSRSAELGFAQGQMNLGQMYLNGQYVDKDFNQALYWFKQAALQSDKAAVLKYVIVCRQVSSCYEEGFYKELTEAGVNIKVSTVEK